MDQMMAPDPDEALLARTRAGDEEAFLAIYRKLQGPIYRFTLNMTGAASVAEDVTQEVFLALIREKFGYDSSRGTLSGYLFGIARKLVLRHLERSRLLADQEIDAGDRVGRRQSIGPDPMTDLLRAEGIEVLRKAVISLPKRYREVVALCDLEEIDYVEAAAMLGCPVGTVRSRLHRARALLLEKLQQTRDSKTDTRTWNPARSLI
jgi:RNA polymerase sigma-70 factor (ECF subfamily)